MKSLFSILTMCVFSIAVVAEDWPTWRGMERDGLSKETGLIQEWPEGGPQKLWTSDAVGLGYSSYAVVGDRIYTMGAEGDQEFLIALNAADGSKLWQVEAGPLLTNGWGDGPRSTPAVDGDRIYVVAAQGRITCASTDGRKIWSKEMTEMGGSVPIWGYSESALVDGDRVLCTPGGTSGTVVCLNRTNGDIIWQSSDIKAKAHYSSIIKVQHAEQPQYIQLTMKKVFGLDMDGKKLWEADWPRGRTAVIPTPIYRDGYVYITSGYGAGCMLLKLSENNDVEVIYDNKVMKNHHGGVILVGDHLYGYSDGVGWVCQDLMTGERVWNEKSKLGKGAVSYADGMLYCQDEKSGAVVLIEASPEGWNEKGRFVIAPQTTRRKARGRIWSHPVIANGRLYLRDQELLSCYDLSK